MKNTCSSAIELLEARIAPAAFVTFTDGDGDIVKITASKGPLDAADLTLFGGDTGQLRTLTLLDPEFTGANITFTVKRMPNGDGFADVGRINATGVDLGNVTIKGDLAQIDVGNGNAADGPALKTLSVRSLGAYGLESGGNLTSIIDGHVVALKVKGDVQDAVFLTDSIGTVTIGGSLDGGNIFASGTITAVKIGKDVLGGVAGNSGLVQAFGKLSSVTVGGSLLGGTGLFSGAIRGGELGTVKIGGDVVGSVGNNSGTITSAVGKIGGVTIGGSLRGGLGSDSGKIDSTTDLDTVRIGGDVQGGAGSFSGTILTGGKVKSLTIGGSLLGSTGSTSGSIFVTGTLGTVKIDGDVRGGTGQSTGIVFGTGIGSLTIGGSIIGGAPADSTSSLFLSGGIRSGSGDIGAIKIGGDLISGSVTGSASLIESGAITSFGRIGSITIGGSVIAGIDTSTGAIERSAQITARYDLGSLTVKGSLLGNTIGDDSFVNISAVGQATPTGITDVAMGKISIGGRVEYALILGGYTSTGPLNGNAQIGAITVGGDWFASSVSAGVKDTNGDGFGGTDDAVINNAADPTVARIASITIKGIIIGGHAAADQFGFVAQQIDAFKVNGVARVRTPGTDPVVVIAYLTGDVTLREI